MHRDEEREKERQSDAHRKNEKEEFTFKRNKLLRRRNIKVKLNYI